MEIGRFKIFSDYVQYRLLNVYFFASGEGALISVVWHVCVFR